MHRADGLVALIDAKGAVAIFFGVTSQHRAFCCICDPVERQVRDLKVIIAAWGFARNAAVIKNTMHAGFTVLIDAIKNANVCS